MSLILYVNPSNVTAFNDPIPHTVRLCFLQWALPSSCVCVCPCIHACIHLEIFATIQGVKMNILPRPRNRQLLAECSWCILKAREMLPSPKCLILWRQQADGSLLYLSAAHYRHLADYLLQCYSSNYKKKASVPWLSACIIPYDMMDSRSICCSNHSSSPYWP